MPQIAKIAVAAATYAIDKPYDYLASEDVLPGQRVLVPFGRGNRTSEGLILSVQRGVPDKPTPCMTTTTFRWRTTGSGPAPR